MIPHTIKANVHILNTSYHVTLQHTVGDDNGLVQLHLQPWAPCFQLVIRLSTTMRNGISDLLKLKQCLSTTLRKNASRQTEWVKKTLKSSDAPFQCTRQILFQ